MNNNHENYKRAQKRVKDTKGFYIHLVWYSIINILLIGINFLTDYGNWWFIWIASFWGVAVVLNFFSVFIINNGFLGKKWEDKKVKEYIKK